MSQVTQAPGYKNEMNPSPDIIDHPARVLIVDDERHNRQLLEVMLTPEGFLLQTAASGEEALSMVAEQAPDLILLDIMMPGMDGYEVTSTIKGNPATKNIPVIMITALDDRNARMLGLNAGAEDFLTKPVDRAELSARVRNLLRLKAYGDYHDQYSQMLESEVGSRMADLIESEARFRELAEAIREVFFLTDPQMTKMLYVSPAYEDVFGRSCESLYAHPQSWSEAIHPDDRKRALDEIAPQGTIVQFDVEYRIVRPDGSERSIRARGFPVYNDVGEVCRFAGIAEDVSEAKILEAQVRQANKMDAIGRLASGVAHDFNNLLTVILGFAEIVVADVGVATEHGKDLREIIKAAQRAAGLTKQLLAFSRQQVLRASPLDVNALIADMTGMLGRLIGEDIAIVLALAPSLSLALADRNQLEQVVMNLVVNARDAMPGGGTLTMETADVELENSVFHEETVAHGRYVMLAITDTGSGMTRETQRRLFEPFFTTKETGKGTGLGLSTTYGIVKQTRGYIWVYSEIGRGTTFKVYLPHSNPDAALPALSSVASAPVKSPSETVLLVEDEASVRHLSKRILDKAGYRVLEAANGDDAEKLFAEHAESIGLVVTDVVMPGCSGPELFSRLQVKAPALRVLYMSGYTEQSVAPKTGIDRGFPFVQKPFTAAQLTRQVRDALDR